MRDRVRWGLIWLALLLLMVGLLGCGASQPPTATPVSGKVPILVTSKPGSTQTDRVVTLVAEILRQRGYRVVGKGESHAVKATVSIRSEKQKTYLTQRANAQVVESYITKATINVRAGKTKLGRETITLSSGDIEAGDVAPLARAVVGADFQQFAAGYGQKPESVAKAEKADGPDADGAPDAELARYRATQPEGCAEPTTPQDCDALEVFLKEAPDSSYADEAREALKKGRPAIAKLRDDQTWTAAKIGSCQLPKTSTDCDGVRAYLDRFPTGAHAEEATAILQKQAPVIAELAAAEKAGTP